MTVERTLSVQLTTWRKRNFNSKKAVIVSLAICLFIFIIVTALGLTVTINDEEGEIYPNFTCFDQIDFDRLMHVGATLNTLLL